MQGWARSAIALLGMQRNAACHQDKAQDGAPVLLEQSDDSWSQLQDVASFSCDDKRGYSCFLLLLLVLVLERIQQHIGAQ